jgi:hypothetical protein
MPNDTITAKSKFLKYVGLIPLVLTVSLSFLLLVWPTVYSYDSERLRTNRFTGTRQVLVRGNPPKWIPVSEYQLMKMKEQISDLQNDLRQAESNRQMDQINAERQRLLSEMEAEHSRSLR